MSFWLVAGASFVSVMSRSPKQGGAVGHGFDPYARALKNAVLGARAEDGIRLSKGRLGLRRMFEALLTPDIGVWMYLGDKRGSPDNWRRIDGWRELVVGLKRRMEADDLPRSALAFIHSMGKSALSQLRNGRGPRRLVFSWKQVRTLRACLRDEAVVDTDADKRARKRRRKARGILANARRAAETAGYDEDEKKWR